MSSAVFYHKHPLLTIVQKPQSLLQVLKCTSLHIPTLTFPSSPPIQLTNPPLFKQTDDSNTDKLHPPLPPRSHTILPIPAYPTPQTPRRSSPNSLQNLHTSHPPPLQRAKQHPRLPSCSRPCLRCFFRKEFLWPRRPVSEFCGTGCVKGTSVWEF